MCCIPKETIVLDDMCTTKHAQLSMCATIPTIMLHVDLDPKCKKNVMLVVETCIDPPSAHSSFGIIEGVALCMVSTIHINNAPYTIENTWPKWKHNTIHIAFTFAWMP